MMKSSITIPLVLAACVAATMLTSGCVNVPTEKQSISDVRPQISFKIGSEQLQTARVQLDGLDMGAVSDYVDGVATMRILPGTHMLRVIYGSTVVLEEKFYLGDGANRAFIVR
jgi:hypothetical protein